MSALGWTKESSLMEVLGKGLPLKMMIEIIYTGANDNSRVEAGRASLVARSSINS